MWSHYGLTNHAKKLIIEEDVEIGTTTIIKKYKDKKRKEDKEESPLYENPVKKEVYKKVSIWRGGILSLFKYETPHGTYFEDIQADLMWQGSNTFLALKNEEGNWIKETLWENPERALFELKSIPILNE